MEKYETRTVNGHQLAVTFLDAGSKDIVIFCHGYRSSSIGPNRFFVSSARQLAKHGISSLRFDQYGSGNSEGDFIDSSFDDWVATARSLAQEYLANHYRVVLFGQSMGGSTVLVVASKMPKLSAVVAWVPDPSVEVFKPPASGIIEEAGQIVQAKYWREAHDAHIAEALNNIKVPSYIVQASKDEYVSAENHAAITAHARINHAIEMFDGYTHSSWSYAQAMGVIEKSVDFIVREFQGTGYLNDATDMIRYLQSHRINPILYGSYGLSLYLGRFKKFDDIDLLIEPDWLSTKWHKLIKIMQTKGFKLTDEHEHEFKNSAGNTVAFAKNTVLVRDGISKTVAADVVMQPLDGLLIRTLSLLAFKRAYEFSQKDGYRQASRGKKDHEIIKLINDYCSKYM